MKCKLKLYYYLHSSRLAKQWRSLPRATTRLPSSSSWPSGRVSISTHSPTRSNSSPCSKSRFNSTTTTHFTTTLGWILCWRAWRKTWSSKFKCSTRTPSTSSRSNMAATTRPKIFLILCYWKQYYVSASFRFQFS